MLFIVPACGLLPAVDFPTNKGRQEVKRKYRFQYRWSSLCSVCPHMMSRGRSSQFPGGCNLSVSRPLVSFQPNTFAIVETATTHFPNKFVNKVLLALIKMHTFGCENAWLWLTEDINFLSNQVRTGWLHHHFKILHHFFWGSCPHWGWI